VVCAFAAWVAVCAPAEAQSQRPTGGPFSGLFRTSRQDQPQTLDLRASAFTAWDDNVLAQIPSGFGGINDTTNVDPRTLKPGVGSGFQADLVYGLRKSGTRSQFSLNGDAAVQQFAAGLDSGALWFQSYNASTSLRTSITNKTSVLLGASSSYQPYYQYAPFLKSTTGEDSPVGSDHGFAVDSAFVRSYVASAAVENRFSKRSGISAGVDWQHYDVLQTENLSVDTRIARVGFNHSLTRKLGFHLGYGVQESRGYTSNPDAKPVQSQFLDVGINYGDGLTLNLSRRTILTLRIGAGIAKNGDPASVVTTGKSTAFVVDGSATLSRSLGRTWGTSVGYVRGTSYTVGFPQPMVTDSLSAGIGGELATRLHFSAGAGATRGQQLFAESGGDLVSYSASTRLTYGLFSHLGLYAQASYYRFSIPSGFLTNFPFVPKLDRRSVSVGLTTWVPLIKHRRVRRDSGDPTPTGQP